MSCIKRLYSRISLWISARPNVFLWLDRILAGKPSRQFWLFLALFVVTLIISTLFYGGWGVFSDWESLQKAFVDMTSPVSVRNSAYDVPEEHRKLNFWAFFAVYMLGILVFTGLLIATLTNLWRTRADKFRRGVVKYYFKHHVVFLGYNDLIVGMIQKMCEDSNGQIRIVVGVENNTTEINDRIKSRLYDDYKKRVVILQADSCNRSDLERLRIPYAESVYIIGEHDDAYNLKSYRTIYEISLCTRKAEERMPQCYVNLQHQSTLSLFQTYASAGDIGVDFSAFNAFNFSDEWARYLIIGDRLKEESRIDYRNESSKHKSVHLVIIGMTEMGRALARQALLMCHYPTGPRTKITFIDHQVDLLSKQLIGSHQQLFKYCKYTYFDLVGNKQGLEKPQSEVDLLNIEFEFYKADISDIVIREKIEDWALDDNQLLTIAVCLPKASQSLAAGLYLPDILFRQNRSIPIWIHQPTFGDLGNYLRGSSRYKNVVTFGMSGKDLDVCRRAIIDRAKRINHYFKNRKQCKDITYDNYRWIEMEWEENEVCDKWLYINRSIIVTDNKNNFGDLNTDEMEKLAKNELRRLNIFQLMGLIPPLNEFSKTEEIEYFMSLDRIIQSSDKDLNE